jgi:hypothetical protein
MSINLVDEPDRFSWRLTSSRSFSVKYMYTDFLNEHIRFLLKYLWKLKVPLKIKVFMWFLRRKVLLTKDNLAKRQWTSVRRVLFVTLGGLLIISLFHVHLLNLFKELFILLLMLIHLLMQPICLGIDLMGLNQLLRLEFE